MTPEETKAHVEQRLRELGWSVHIGAANYERIARFAAGADVTRLCSKLVAFGVLQNRREITDDVVEMAVLDLARDTEAAGAGASPEDSPIEADRGLIDQLAAALEARAATAPAEPEPPRGVRRPAANGGSGRAAAETAPLPKLLLVEPDPVRRKSFAQALSSRFRVLEAADGDSAWQVLAGDNDVELLVSELTLPGSDGFELIGRVRRAHAPPQLAALPIMILAAPEQAEAKLRVLTAGANDFMSARIDPARLLARASARHRLSREAAHIAAAPARAVAHTVPFGTVRAARPPEPRREPRARRAPVVTLTAERRYRGGEALTGVARGVSRRSNATTTITVAATVLLALAMLGVFHLSRDGTPWPFDVARRAPAIESPPADPVKPQTPSLEIARPDASRASPPRSAQDTAPPPSSGAAGATPRAEPAPTESAAREQPVARAPNPRPPVRSSAEGHDEPAAKPPASTASPESGPPASAPEVSGRGAGVPDLPSSAPALPPPAADVPVPPRAPATAEAPHVEEEPPAPDAASVDPGQEQAPIPPVAAARPALPPNRISRDELSAFLTRFASVYEAGDLEQFMSLFAEHARTNDRRNRNGIRQDYEALFRTTDTRQMNLGEISWEVDGAQAQGWGEFDVSVRRRGDSQSYRYTGSLTFVVEKADGRLRILRLYHGQQRVDS